MVLFQLQLLKQFREQLEQFRVERIYLGAKYFNLEKGEYLIARLGKNSVCAFDFIDRNEAKFLFL